MSEQLCPRDLAILECGGMAIPPTISLAVQADEGGGKPFNPPPASKSEGVSRDTPQARRRTFADRIAASPQLVEATITRAIRLAAYRERQAARKLPMAIRLRHTRVC